MLFSWVLNLASLPQLFWGGIYGARSGPLFSWIWKPLFLTEQNVNPRVWVDGKTVGWTQNAIPVIIKLKDSHLFPRQKQYPLKLMNGWNLTVLISHGISGILNSKVQSDNGSLLKAAVTQGVLKALGIDYHLHCSWRPQSSEKVEKANAVIKRHPCKLTQETQDSWFKVLPMALMRAWTAHE